MAISNSASGFRPGVCTSTTRPTSPFNGQVIYETDTKQTLVWQGTAWVMLTDADTPPGLQLVKTQTVGTGVSSVTVTDVFSSDYDSYRIIVSGGAGSGTTQAMNIKLGASIASYYSCTYYADVSASTPSNAGVNNGSIWTYGGLLNTDTIRVSFDLINPFLAKHTLLTNCSYVDTTVFGTTNGIHRVATSYTDFTLSPQAGTITGGTIRVYGYRNTI